MKSWLQPLQYEKRYSRFLYKEMRKMHLELLSRLTQVEYFYERRNRQIEEEPEESKKFKQATEKDSDDISLLIAGLILWWQAQSSTTTTIYRGYFVEVNKFNDNQFRLVVKDQTGLDLPPSQSVGITPGETVSPSFVLAEKLGEKADIFREEEFLRLVKENWLATQKTYVDKVIQESLSDAEILLRNALVNESQKKIVEELLDKKFTTLGSRVTSFGIDQIHKLNTALVKQRQKSIGVEEYIWETRRDERVRGNPTGLYPNARPSHYARHSRIFNWNNPPEGGHPGEAPGCRCSAVMRLPR